MTRVRLATGPDSQDIRVVYLRSFSDDEKHAVSDLAVNLLSQETRPETISLVAEIDGAMVGHIAFSPVKRNEGTDWQGYILAPLGVVPEYQRRGVGRDLIKNGMEQLTTMGVDVVFVYGDPKYYGQFGFETELAALYKPPYPLQFPFGWQAVALTDRNQLNEEVSISTVESLNHPELW